MTTWPADWNAPIPAQYEALIFDCDGTLVDTMPAHYVAWCHALAPSGITFSEQRFYEFAGVPTVTIVETLSREQSIACDAEAIAREKDRLYLTAHDRGQPIGKVVAIAEREKGRRQLAVASGGFTEIVRTTLRAAGIEQLFEVVVGAEQVTRGKPSPDVFLRAAELLGIAPERCVVYEDAELGFQAARAAGMAVVDVRPWYLPR